LAHSDDAGIGPMTVLELPAARAASSSMALRGAKADRFDASERVPLGGCNRFLTSF